MPKIVATGLVLWLLASQSFADTNGEDSFETVLASIFKSARTVNTIESNFELIREVSLLTDPIVTTGRFYYQKSDALRWEVESPEPMGFWVKGSRGKRWKGNEAHSQTFAVSSVPFIDLFARQVFAWANGNLDILTTRYQMGIITTRPLVLKLSPIKADEKQYLANVQLTFSEGLDHIQKVLICLADGDQAKINFTNAVLNKPFPDALFE